MISPKFRAETNCVALCTILWTARWYP